MLFISLNNISCGINTKTIEMSAKPTCLIVASASPQGVSAASFHQSFSLCSSVFNLQTATPGGKPIDFVGVDESTARWVQDFNVKPYATPAKLESIDGARYQALLLPDCPGALNDLAHRLSAPHPHTLHLPTKTCLCSGTRSVRAVLCHRGPEVDFSGYSLTGPSVFELVRRPDFANLPLVVEDFVKDSGGSYTASQEDAVHVVIDRHLITGQNMQSTSLAVNNLILLSNAK
ncbi:hypothetical protein F7725_022950 [Dissostichus mawsoni]|uniref:Glutamine amidotransferase-like class 1 domain-containing protein 1 n=1 Tax=Dissostichus mawsoni TaxID=36200 RepID=A0A7J5YZB9_DISMA|nr:hypothetical protein F7725_022950 [Dissostichus mawsoni]